MTDSTETSRRAAIVTLEDFDGCHLEPPMPSLQLGDMVSISLGYKQASAGVEGRCKTVYDLLSAICGMHLNPGDRGDLWRASASNGTQRYMLPADIKGPQSDILAEVLVRVKSPSVRARLADVVWSNNLRDARAAITALDSYCDVIDGLLDGSLQVAFPAAGRELFETERPIHRSLQIASAIGNKGVLPERLKALCKRTYVKAMDTNQPVFFSAIAYLCVEYKIMAAADVARDAEAVARADASIYPEALRRVWVLAGSLYQRLGDLEAQTRCEIGAVRELLRMRDQCGPAGAKSAWVMDALMHLRHIKGEEADRLSDELETELRILQRASVRTLGSIPIDLDLPEERNRLLQQFSSLNLSDALRSFAFFTESPKIEELRASALEQGRQSPLISMMAVNFVDHEGKVVAKTSGSSSGTDNPPDDWFIHMIERAESLRRAATVCNGIEPVRLLLNNLVLFEERHFLPIVYQSPFVGDAQARLFALGLSRMFQGDYASAVHILVPQLEPSLRHLLKASGVEPIKRRNDATEEDRSLDAIFRNHRASLNEIFGPAHSDELDRVFNRHPGPILRHAVAHGQISAGGCYTPDAIYGCWLLYRTCCLFVFQDWDNLISPGLELEEPGR